MAILSEHLLVWPGIQILSSPAGSVLPVAENLAAGSYSSQLHVFAIEGKKARDPLTPIPASVGKASEMHLHSPSSQVPTPLTNHRARTVRCSDQPSLGHMRGDP